MKTKASIFLSLVMTVCILAGCSPKVNPTDGGQQKNTYSCPMHPEVVSDKPGTCPKCGMELVKSDSKGNHNHKMHNMNHSGGGCGMM